MFGTVVFKHNKFWQKINLPAFQLVLRYWRGWGQLSLDSE